LASKLSRKLLIFVALLFLFLALWTVLIEPRWVAKRTINIALPHSGSLAGLKVAVASDWHFTKRPLWRVMTVERAQQIVAEINESKPDVILLLGDFVADRQYVPTIADSAEEEIAQVLGQLKAPKGVYAVLGNHDWWRDGSKMYEAFTKQGIKVVENTSLSLPGTDAYIVGIGDDFTGHSNPELALKNLSSQKPALLMMHDPASFSTLPSHLNAVAFAGHTHGGQVYLPWLGALVVPGRAPTSWAYGWVEHHANRMYVTSGLGVSIIPVRFNMRPEWVLFSIH
jgi:predicted MPP superfamily phosphohydrolase